MLVHVTRRCGWVVVNRIYNMRWYVHIERACGVRKDFFGEWVVATEQRELCTGSAHHRKAVVNVGGQKREIPPGIGTVSRTRL